MYKKLVKDMLEKQLKRYFNERCLVIHKDMKIDEYDNAVGTVTMFSKDYNMVVEFRYCIVASTGNILIEDRTNGYQSFYIY